MFRPKGPTLILMCKLYCNCKATYAWQICQDLDLGTLLDGPLEVNLVNCSCLISDDCENQFIQTYQQNKIATKVFVTSYIDHIHRLCHSFYFVVLLNHLNNRACRDGRDSFTLNLFTLNTFETRSFFIEEDILIGSFLNPLFTK